MKSNSIISSTGIHKFIQYIVMCVYCDANIQRQKDNEMYLMNMCQNGTTIYAVLNHISAWNLNVIQNRLNM